MNNEINGTVKKLSTEGIEFLGIGKIMFEDLNFDFNIPHLHFLTSRETNGNVEAFNLEFQLKASAESQIIAIKELVKKIIFNIIGSLIGRDEFKNIKELKEIEEQNNIEAYWRKYREINFNLALHKQNINSKAVMSKYKSMINSFMNQAISELIIEIVKNFESEFDIIIQKYLSIFQKKPTVVYQDVLEEYSDDYVI